MQIATSVPFVTGANRGIGKAYIEAYLAAGVKKVYAAARKRSDLDAVVSLDSKRVIPVVLDVTNQNK